MDYSIVIPVFNKAALTRHCLETLRPTLGGAGEGEVIVIDNASSDETPQMLAEFPWIRMVRNEENLGFAGANNQGARLANGKFLVLLNNDTEAKPGWLASMLETAREPGVGAVGARLLYPNGTIQHAGVAVAPLRIGRAGFLPFHDLYNAPGDHPYARERHEYQVVTGACLVTPRELYLELGGLDEGYWNGYEDVDYCLKVRERGMTVMYDGRAVLTHFESQSGPARFRKAAWNTDRLARRWGGRTSYDEQTHSLQRGNVRRVLRLPRGVVTNATLPVPPITVLCHGDANRKSHAAFVASVHANVVPVSRVEFVDAARAIERARDEMELRGDRYLVLVDTRCELREGWLDELVRQAEWGPAVGGAAYATEIGTPIDGVVYAPGARCTLIALRKFPAHIRLQDAPSLNAAVSDFLNHGIELRAFTRAASADLASLPPVEDEAPSADPARFEQRLAQGPRRRSGLVSIVMLSWNAPEFTKIALESIRAHTRGEYEVIIVDNGSRDETVEWLRTVEDPAGVSGPPVRVIYNAANRGYAGGNNQALAAARGEYVVLLNNDVVVTDGWLDGLLSAFDRVPGLGVSAPRSNKIAGDQIVSDASYQNLDEMHAYAAQRSARFRDTGYMTDRAIGLCLCIDRRVIEETGGIDERFGVGNFEDDDFCLRIRAAGYGIHVCDDVFIHHFGSQTFAANKVDWSATMRENWTKFAVKWGLPREFTGNGYDPAPLVRRGFLRAQHYVALPQVDDAGSGTRSYDLVFSAPVRDERDWTDVAAFVRRYVRAFSAQQSVLLAIAACGELDARTLGNRAERLAEREGISPQDVADIAISDELSIDSWSASLESDVKPIAALEDRSPSALRRLLERRTTA